GDSSGLVSNTLSGTGGAGHLFVSAPRLEIDGGLIQAQRESTSRGNAGAIRVEVGTLKVAGGAMISSGTFGSGPAGPVTEVAGQLILAEEDQDGFRSVMLALSARGSRGDAGAIRVEVGTLVVRDGARISSTTQGSGQGGMIMVRVTDTIALGPNSSSNVSG